MAHHSGEKLLVVGTGWKLPLLNLGSVGVPLTYDWDSIECWDTHGNLLLLGINVNRSKGY